MRLALVRKIMRESLTGDKLPSWIDALIGPVNQMFDQVFAAFNKNLTFEDNIMSTRKVVKLKHNTATKVSHDLAKCIGVNVFYASGYVVTGLGWTPNNDGTVSVTIQFSGAPSGFIECSIMFYGG